MFDRELTLFSVLSVNDDITSHSIKQCFVRMSVCAGRTGSVPVKPRDQDKTFTLQVDRQPLLKMFRKMPFHLRTIADLSTLLRGSRFARQMLRSLPASLDKRTLDRNNRPPFHCRS